MGLFSPNTANDENEIAKVVFHFPTSKKALIIFTRNPELGKVKTRLAATIGDEKALKVYKLLIAHTIKITQNITADKYVFYSNNIQVNDAWDNTIFRKKLQKGDDLGMRMKNAFQELFSMGYEKVLIVGTDIYELTQQDIEEAFTQLKDNKFVIGPAEDGGYYLLGMKEINLPVFENKNWGTQTVLQDTLNDLQNEKVVLFPKKNDIDRYEDITKFKNKCNRSIFGY